MKKFLLLGPVLFVLSMILSPASQAQSCDVDDINKTINEADIGFKGLWKGDGIFKVLEVYQGELGREVGVDFLAFGPSDKIFLVDPPFDIESEVYVFAFKWASVSERYRDIGEDHDYYTIGCLWPTPQDPRRAQ